MNAGRTIMRVLVPAVSVTAIKQNGKKTLSQKFYTHSLENDCTLQTDFT